MSYYVYILASRKYGTLYVGVTNNLARRVYEHKEEMYRDSFTAKYNVKILVYYEEHQDVWVAIYREKLIKRWNRQWKINHIKKINPEWKDLHYEV